MSPTSLQPPIAAGDVDGTRAHPTFAAERVIAVVFALLRCVTLALAAGQLASGDPRVTTSVAAAALGVVGATSAGVFLRALVRSYRGSSVWLLDDWAALAETLAGVAGLLLL